MQLFTASNFEVRATVILRLADSVERSSLKKIKKRFVKQTSKKVLLPKRQDLIEISNTAKKVDAGHTSARPSVDEVARLLDG